MEELKSNMECGFSKGHIKPGVNLFDVTMGAYGGAEICELVGLYMLNKINTFYPNNVGLYHDDGLAVFKNIRHHSPRELTSI